MTTKTNNPGIFQTLIAQLDKIFRHNRQGSFRTKKRYYEAMKRFCRFLADPTITCKSWQTLALNI